MMLKSERIAELLERADKPDETDPFVIAPRPDIQDLRDKGAASIDLRLGTWFVTLREARMGHLAVDHKSVESQLTRKQYVPFGKSYYLHPRSFVLSVTLEWIRLPGNLAAYVIGRSSWGRRGLIIATATGVHPGFKGCLTLELSNVGELPIEIKPGMRICQLCIHTVDAGTTPHIDSSQFVGSRMPSLGSIDHDDLSKRLAKANTL
jgi:dCTP deaminase